MGKTDTFTCVDYSHMSVHFDETAAPPAAQKHFRFFMNKK